MTQQISPFIEAKYGWAYGESGWNAGVDEDLLKFSFLFNGNVDGVVSSLPAAVDGEAYYLTTDSRLYFCVGTTWYSSPTPRWFQFRNKNTGVLYEYNGTFLSEIQSPTQLGGRLDAVEATISSLGTAAFQDVSAFATQSALDVAVGQSQAYTDTLRSDLAATSGSSLIGFTQTGTGAVARTAQEKQRERVSVKDFGAVGDGVADDTTAIQNAIDAIPAGGGTVFIPAGKYKITSTIVVGNGSNSAVSSKNCVKLQGEGMAPYFGNYLGTTFVWAGAAGGKMLEFAGSGEGFGLDRVELDCAGVAATGLSIFSTRLSTYSNFSVREFTGAGIDLNVRLGPGTGVLFASGNLFQNWISTSTIGEARGISIKGDYANNNDWHRNTFLCGQTQIQKASSGESYGAYLEFTDSNTWIECDLNVYGTGAGFGLYLNGANNNAYPQNNFFYGCSIVSTTWYETSNVIGNNFFYGFCTADNEVIPVHSKLRGITDTGSMFGGFSFTGTSSNVVIKNNNGNAQWKLLNNSNDSSSFGFVIAYSTDGVTWTNQFQISPTGDVSFNIPGVGFRTMGVGDTDSAGVGYRALRVSN